MNISPDRRPKFLQQLPQSRSQFAQELKRQHEGPVKDAITARAEKLNVLTDGLRDRLAALDRLLADVIHPNTESAAAQAAAEEYFRIMDEIHKILNQVEAQQQVVQSHTAPEQPRLPTIEQKLEQRLQGIRPQNPQKWHLLYAALQEEVAEGVVRGSQTNYTFADLVRIISVVKNDPAKIDLLTHSGGIYDTVKSFLDAEAGAANPEIEPRNDWVQPILDAFAQFSAQRQNEIQRELQQGFVLSDIIYDTFYAEDIAHQRYPEGSAVLASADATYKKSAAEVASNLMRLYETNKLNGDTSIVPNAVTLKGEWLYYDVHGGLENKKQPTKNNRGRLYIHIEPTLAPEFFEQALQRFAEHNVPMEAKISAKGGVENINRREQMVLYFDEKHSERVLGVMEMLYSLFEPHMIDDIPPCTAQLKHRTEQKMTGVSFAQDPAASQQSFGETRSIMLAELYTTASQQQFPLNSPQAREHFSRICLKYGVDPINPAFNIAQEGVPHFSSIRERLAVPN